MKIYFVPFLIDFILFLVQFRLADASGREMPLSNPQATALLIAFNLTYLAVCPFVGRALNARNTKPILLFSIAAILVFGVPLLWTKNFALALIFLGGLGAASALAFNAFQALMRDQTPVGALSGTVAKYNVSWALGIGLGFLMSGVLKTLGQPFWLSALCGVAIFAVWMMIWSETPQSSTRLRSDNAQTPDAASGNVASDGAPHLWGDARYVAIGWSLCLAGNFVQRPLATFLPKFSAHDGNGAWVAGTLLCALMWTQAAAAYACYKNPQWFYRARPLVVFQVGVAAVLGALWLSNSYWFSLSMMMALGLLHGFAFFSAVFYCSNSFHSARNVGINEMAVGVGNLGGMIICNMAISRLGDLAFYPATMAFCALLLGVQLWWLRASRQKYAKAVAASA